MSLDILGAITGLFVVVYDGQHALRFTLGRARSVVGPGIHFKWPFVQRIQRLSLNTFTLNIVSPNVFTEQGVAVTVEGVAQVKISNNDDLLAVACQIFLDKDENEIQVRVL